MISVLFVDDEPTLLDVGKILLEESGNFSVTTAESAPTALELLKNGRFDAIVSDYMMPEMDGIRFLIEVRTRFGPVPFVMFTGKGGKEEVIQIINHGADFYLEKGDDAELQFVDLSHKIQQAVSRKQAADALQETNAYLNNLFDYANAPIMTWDPEFRITRFNHAFEHLTGRKQEEVLGKTPDFLFPYEFRKASMALIKMALKGKRWEAVEMPILSKDGSIRTVIWNSANILDSNGTIVSSIAQGVDITDRKRVETALQLANKQLNLLSSITRQDIISHLTVLTGYLHLLEMKQRDSTLREYCRISAIAAKKISAIIKFTKDYDGIEEHFPDWQWDWRTLVEAAIKETPLTRVVVKNDLPIGVEVFADPLITKVCNNLMDNMVRYGGKITTIRFSIKEYSDDIVIVCEDDGYGVLAEDKEKIFERRYRSENTGLGLFLSREILSITGMIIIENGTPGKGTRFEITVPKGAYRFTGTKRK
jgi:PAS domain S-box-containing protein